MLFNSYAFIAFLPCVWIIYFLLNHFKWYRTAQFSLIVFSFVFYGYADYRLCYLLAFSILVNFALHLLLMRKDFSRRLRGLWLSVGILANLGLLFYFKYFDFTIMNVIGYNRDD